MHKTMTLVENIQYLFYKSDYIPYLFRFYVYLYCLYVYILHNDQQEHFGLKIVLEFIDY
jgi:hypothetical protein